MRKKITAALLTVLTLTVSISTNTYNAQAADTVTVIVDGRTVDFPDAPAYIDENGRTQLPARYIGEALGAHVAWDEASKKVTISRRSLAWDENNFQATYINFYIDSEVYYTYVGDSGSSVRHTMDTNAVIEQGRTYVPVRYIAEALGAEVDWNEQTRTVMVTSETKTVGDFVIPKSCTDSVLSLTMGITSFGITLRSSLSGSTDHENRIQIVIHILSQRLEEATIKDLEEFILNNMEFNSNGLYDYKYTENMFGEPTVSTYGNNIFDSKTGQYVRIVRRMSPESFVINIYNIGLIPSEVDMAQ